MESASLRRPRKYRAHLSLKARKAIAEKWLGARPVSCAIAAAADFSAGTKHETRNLYATWKESSMTWGVSYPAFERILATLLAQPDDATETDIPPAVWAGGLCCVV